MSPVTRQDKKAIQERIERAAAIIGLSERSGGTASLYDDLEARSFLSPRRLRLMIRSRSRRLLSQLSSGTVLTHH